MKSFSSTIILTNQYEKGVELRPDAKQNETRLIV